MKPIFYIQLTIKKFIKFALFSIAMLSLNYVSFAGEGTVVTVTYTSTTQSTECKMNIYLPAGYNDLADSVNSYPVFYLIHGGGENYAHWVNSGYAHTTLNSYIESGKAVPMILVMPDGKNLAADIFSNELINDIIPYIETNYRVKADKDHRGVGGLSWGGLQALEPGLYHYEMFGYISILSSGWFTTETATYKRAKDFLQEHGTEMERSIRYLYYGDGFADDIAYENGLATMKVLNEGGLTVHYWQHPSGHWWGVWREDFKAFVPYLFRDSTTVYISLNFQGGNVINSTIMTHIDSALTAPTNPTKTGYTFENWYKEPDCINPFDFATETINKNTTIYANWNINSYEVTFDSNGGTEITDTITTEYNSKIDEPSQPAMDGFVFDGWYTTKAFSKKWNFSTDKVTKNITLIANWISPTDVKSKNTGYFMIYPNPTKNKFKIANLTHDAFVDIFDLNGKLAVHKKVLNSNQFIEVDNLSTGIYAVRITCSEKHYYTKIAIE